MAVKFLYFGKKISPSDLKTQLPKIRNQQTFDGIAIDLIQDNHDLRDHFWGDELDWASDLKPLAELLKSCAPDFGNLSDNYLRVGSKPGVDLMDSPRLENVMRNAEYAGRLIGAGGLKGVYLDFEHYGKLKMWEGTEDRPPDWDWQAYSAAARAAGRRFLQALYSGAPGVNVFIVWSLAGVWSQLFHLNEWNSNAIPFGDANYHPNAQPYRRSHYALVVPFVHGLYEEMHQYCHTGRISTPLLIDGNAGCYGARNWWEFAVARRILTEYVPRDLFGTPGDPLLPVPWYWELTSCSLPIWLDYRSVSPWYREQEGGWSLHTNWGWPKKPDEDPHSEPDWPTYYTAEQFKHAVRCAMQYVDHYVWFYSEHWSTWIDKYDGRAAHAGGEWWDDEGNSNSDLDLHRKYLDELRRPA